MPTECRQLTFDFAPLAKRDVVADFEGGTITSDAGALLLRELEAATTIIQRFADCFSDHRDPQLIEHSITELVAPRVYGLALGYEDLNDHDELRKDPLLATLVGKADPTGQSRVRRRDQGTPLAGKSTLNRLELTPKDGPTKRYKKTTLDGDAVDRFFVETFVQAHTRAPERIVLDFDATDDPLHGKQEGRFFHGYYREYCYLPLYVFCDDFLLAARLRPSDIDAAKGTVEELERIVPQIREQWPEVEIIVRADAGFCRDEIMAWCEENRVEYVLGLAKNERLKGGDCRGARECEGRVEGDGKSGADLQGVSLPYSEVVGSRTARGRQSGASLQGTQPAVHRDVVLRKDIRSRGALRVLLWPR